MKATKKIAALFSAAAVALGAWATPPNVMINSVQQNYPNPPFPFRRMDRHFYLSAV